MDDNVRVFYSILLFVCLAAVATILSLNAASGGVATLALFAVFAAPTLYHNRKARKTAGLWR